MLYTVVPLERIYSYRTESLIISKNSYEDKSNPDTEYKTVSLPHGRVYAKRHGDNYIVDRVTSTDMSDYLNPGYAPGMVIDVHSY